MAEFEWAQKILVNRGTYKQSVHAEQQTHSRPCLLKMERNPFWYTARKYRFGQAYYDSAINSFTKDFENYEAIQKRQEILTEFVKYSETIELQNSLLLMAKMDLDTKTANTRGLERN